MQHKVSKIDPAMLKPPGTTKNPLTVKENDYGALSKSLSSDAPDVEPEETGDLGNITNAHFISAVIKRVPDGASPAICSKSGDPDDNRGWPAVQAHQGMDQLVDDKNNYLNCCSFDLCDGSFKARKEQFAALHFVSFDDLNTKVPLDRLGDVQLSWKIETSPGNFQGGIILDEPITDAEVANRLVTALLAAGLSDKGASGFNRWVRLPNAINGKRKHKVAGKPFPCRLVEWHPEKRCTINEIEADLELDIRKEVKTVPVSEVDSAHEADEIFIPKASENPVITELKSRGLYKTPLGSGKHDVTCPWVHEHTDALDTGAAFFEPGKTHPVGGFKCHHSHGDRYRLKELLNYLDIDRLEAMNKSLIRVVQGDLHRVVDAAEEELARQGKYFQSGGLIVSIATDSNNGDPTIVPINKQALTRELSVAASWEKYDGRSREWVRCDPPVRHTAILYDAMDYRHLPSLKGLARQPYFRECDGELVTQPGYDRASKMFGVFVPRLFEAPDPTQASALEALRLLKDLLQEFRFVSEADKAAALSAMFTAVVRPSLPHAPGFHVRAPASGSGKTYLCELIGAMAGPGGNAKVSYPKSSEEASKVLLSLLITNPAVIEFDDMDSDWTPHGVINRALTAEHITERILGISKTATVSTRSLFLGSGNNVGPVRDLLRRVLTVNIDPRCATPATIRYTGSPVNEVLNNRGRYVTAVLTIIQAWRKEGSLRADVESIATYGGAWADYCRHPLMWLGLPDPATVLLEQINHDPDAEALGRLLLEWHKAFGSAPTTVRKALSYHPTSIDDDSEGLLDAIKEFPVEERGGINRSKLGWILKKNSNRIVNGLKFQRGDADGRTAWMVVEAGTTSS